MSRPQSISQVPLGLLAEAITRHPYLLIGLCLALTVGAIHVTWSHLEIQTGRNDLLSPDLPYNRRYLDFIGEFSNLEGGLIVVEAADADRAVAYAEDLAADLSSRLPEGTTILFKVDDEAFLRKAIVLLPGEELERLAGALEGSKGLIQSSLSSRGLEDLFGGLAPMIGEARGEEDFPREALPILSDLLGRLAAAVGGDGKAGPLLGGVAKDRAQYTWSDDRRFLFMMIDPYPEEDSELTRRVRDSMGRVGPRHREVKAGLTGRPVLAQDEMETVRQDMIVASVASVLAVALLFIIFFRSFVQPLLGVLTLLVGIAWSFGAATILVGHLNLLSVVFGVILIGLGVDFGIHYLARYQEERLRGADPPSALKEAMRQTGSGIVTGGITIASAFFAIMFGTFRGIAEMGIITGVGMLLCMVAMLLLFPCLLVLTDGRLRRRPPGREAAPKALVSIYRHPLPLIALTIILTGGALVLLRGTRFQYNLLELQVQDLESVRFEKKLIKGSGVTSWFCASLWESLPEAREKTARFEALSTVRKVAGIPMLLPEDQDARLLQVSRVRRVLEGMDGPSAAPEIRIAGVLSALSSLSDAFQGAEEGAFEAGMAEAAEQVGALRDRVDELHGQILKTEGGEERLSRIQLAFQEELRSLIASALDHLPVAAMTLEDIPPMVRDKFLGSRGHYLLMVFPREDIWDHDAMKSFLDDLREIDPIVTGAPVQLYESTKIMTTGYGKAGALALVVVFAVILIDFRSLRAAILAMVPLLMGAIWMVGAMGPLGLDFNSANLVVLPLLLGIGVVNGVHLMHRYRESPGALVDILWGSTGKSVVLTSLTTIAGCGAMGVFSRHPGLSSLGYVLSLGVAACLLTSWFALPPLMQLFFRTARKASRRKNKKKRVRAR